MPSLSEPKVERFYFPSTRDLPEEQRGWVDIQTNVTAGVIFGAVNEANTGDQIFAIIAAAIQDWNMTDATGEKAEVTAKNVRLLEYGDFLELTQKINLNEPNSPKEIEDKKKSDPLPVSDSGESNPVDIATV